MAAAAVYSLDRVGCLVGLSGTTNYSTQKNAQNRTKGFSYWHIFDHTSVALLWLLTMGGGDLEAHTKVKIGRRTDTEEMRRRI